jgi:hypothetical protein
MPGRVGPGLRAAEFAHALREARLKHHRGLRRRRMQSVRIERHHHSEQRADLKR